MSFSWMNADVPRAYQETSAGKALAQYRDEVKKRAALLMHLGFSEAETAARCRENIEWDFELNGRCPVADEVPELVKAVYRRAHLA